ncbi:hypothetical protein PspLS_01946 [Pyricularia sp. CBS 133598]|nr:hypothetical protein PspLS_01946 [Pyricularia sp. CBS 133598]
MYFLGTPHRGADSAQLAKLVQQSAGYGTKAFLDDLLPGRGTLDQINDEFRHVCDRINLCSFSEAVPTNFGLTSSLVVDKASAILGLPKERVQYIEADHRHICKFDTPFNANYLIIQRAFLSTIEILGTERDQGSLEDIALFLEEKCAYHGAGQAHQRLVDEILSKSNGIFLWASLMVSKLGDAYSVEDKQAVLSDLPPEMGELYLRTCRSIVQSPSFEHARCVLKWTICAARPLHLTELDEAIKVDIGRTSEASARQIETMTGHLVQVDEASRIHIAHQTTAAFLTKERDGLWIDRTAAHVRLAEVCLTVLCGDDFATPIRGRRSLAPTKEATHAALAEYAANSFSYHLTHSSSADDVPSLLLAKFLRTNVLAWIEKAAKKGDLWILQLTAQRFRAYLARRAKYTPPGSVETQVIEAWATDLHRIVAAFHSNLLVSPSSIHSLIPQFCPSKSILRQLFLAKSGRKLRIVGPVQEDWDDRLTCYPFSEEAYALASCSRLLAVGFSNGSIQVYQIGGSQTFEYIGAAQHTGRNLRHLAFNRSSSLLASCGARRLALWNVGASQGPQYPCIWSISISFSPFSVAFSPVGDCVTLADHGRSALVDFDIADGQESAPVMFHVSSDSDSSEGQDNQTLEWTPSEILRLDAVHNAVALAGRSSVVTIWGLEPLERIGNFEREGMEGVYSTPPTSDMIFNPAPELEILAISYKDGDLVTCNPWLLEQRNRCQLAHTITCLATSSDGRILAGADEDGEIHIFLFETLQPIHRIGRPDDQFIINSLAFSVDNLRLYDIRGRVCNIWEPMVLVPKEDGSDDSSSQPYSEGIAIADSQVSIPRQILWERAVTAIESSTDNKMLFVGRRDGTVDICGLAEGKVLECLQLSSSEICFLKWSESQRCLLSLDGHERCVISQVASVGKGCKASVTRLTEHRGELPIRQVLLEPNANAILVRTDEAISIIGLDGKVVAQKSDYAGCWLVQHPTNESHVVAVRQGSMILLGWSSLELLSPEAPTSSEHILTLPNTEMPWISGSGSPFIAQCLRPSGSRQKELVFIDLSQLSPDRSELKPQTLQSNNLGIQSVIGYIRSTMFFLNSGGWVCSISLKNLPQTRHYTRHFFVPLTWRAGNDDVITIINKSVVALGRGEDLLVLHGFLEFEDKLEL